MAVDDDTGDDLKPKEAFALVAHETRFNILRGLWDASDDTLTFSELRTAVGNPDAGNFNYHLKRLLGRFVNKNQREEGDSATYELTVAGGRVMGAIESGGYHQTDRVGPVKVDGSCAGCKGDIEAVYEDDLARVVCHECDAEMLTFPLPAAAVETYDAADLPDLLDRWVRKTNREIRAEICPLCSGRLDGHLVLEDPDLPAERVGASYTCRQCDRTINGTVSAWLDEHPALVQMMMNQGVDPRDCPPWSDKWRERIEEERLETDPPRVVVRYTIDDETLELVVDETVKVVDIRYLGA
jgi:hypothetical protein